ncbi:MAG: hypothetical protein JJ992_07860, partial [Planctomycetes bacterium]|nr:hypothetical protein [Planctomycetota bacterium]
FAATIGASLVQALNAADKPAAAPIYRSPLQVAFSPDGRLLAASDHTAAAAVFFDVASGKAIREVALQGKPAGIAFSADGKFTYVAECTAGTVAEIDGDGEVMRRLKVGPWPMGLAVAARRGRLLVTDAATNVVLIVELSGGRSLARVPVGHWPGQIAITPDERIAVVANRLPAGNPADPTVAALVTLIDLETGERAADIRLPPNSVNVQDVAVSPDGKWAYLTHNLARAMMPTEQIEFGWINANALTTIDLTRQTLHATILLDRFNDAAANPWGVAIAPNGETLWIALSGTHQLGRLDLARMHALLRQELPEITRQRQARSDEQTESTTRGSMAYSDSWQIGIKDPTSVEIVISAMPPEYGQGRFLGCVFQRFDLPGNGPRGLGVSPDGKRVAAAMYYSGDIAWIDADAVKVARTTPLGNQPAADEARRGESIFHDAEYCFQRWLTCSTCHPDGRSDGLNWDLLNDGIGDMKNTKSLLLCDRTPPMMARGVRPNMEAAVAAGFKFILFQEPKAEDRRAVESYLRTMQPAVSPFLVHGRLSHSAEVGKIVFESPETRCAACHRAPLFTDLHLHNVGTQLPGDEAVAIDTPTLVELWRNAPYLHHGQAGTLQEVFTRWNRDDKHGKTSHLSSEEIDALAKYLRSL